MLPAVHTFSGPPIAEMRLWSEEKVRSSEAEWQDLLMRSDAE